MLDVDAYLARIRYQGDIAPTAETLRTIHRAHMLAVPFENLDIPGRKIVLEPDALIHKIVKERRGGFCYELNGAFAALLRALGFTVTLLSARVAREDGSESPEFDHLALRVDLEEPWLADVGFGELFLEPIGLSAGVEQPEGRRRFRIMEDGGRFQLEHKDQESGWKRDYSFSLQPRELEEFKPMCHYHQTSPDSPFTRKRLCTLAKDDGRITLSDFRFIETDGDRREERVLASHGEWRDALKNYFGVVMEG